MEKIMKKLLTTMASTGSGNQYSKASVNAGFKAARFEARFALKIESGQLKSKSKNIQKNPHKRFSSK